MLLFILGLVIGSICGVFVMCLCRVSADSDKYFYNTQSEYKVYQPTEELTTQPPNRDSLVKTNKINIRESYEKGGGVNTNPPSERLLIRILQNLIWKYSAWTKYENT
jgi:hypothetical protein